MCFLSDPGQKRQKQCSSENVEFRHDWGPLGMNGTAVERVSSCRYLGVHITKDLTWTTHIDTLPPQAAEESLSLPEDPSDLLPCWCGGEHPDRKHHCLVLQQLLSRQEGSAEGGAFR